MSGIIGTSSSKSKIIGRSLDTAKAWIVWKQDDQTVRDSFNVSTIGDVSTGRIQVNLSISMPTIYYVVAGIPHHHDGVNTSGAFSIHSKTVSYFQIYRTNAVDDTNYEVAYDDSIIIFGD